MLKKFIIALVFTVSVISAFGQENIFSQPGFELSGTIGVKRSGERAGKIVSDGKSTFQKLLFPCYMAVEPYAVYHAEGWVKAKYNGGQLRALYSHGFYSYGWFFVNNKIVANTDKWQKVTTTFSIPSTCVLFYPLVFTNVKSGTAYIDDVRIVKIKSGKAHIAELKKKKVLSSFEQALLARWMLLNEKNIPATEKIMQESKSRQVRADIACLLAEYTKNIDKKISYIADMINNNCFSYTGGNSRFVRVVSSLDTAERIEVLKKIKNAKLLQTASVLIFGKLSDTDKSIQQNEQNLAKIKTALKTIDGNRLSTLKTKIAEAEKMLIERRKQSGKAIIKIAGKELTPANYQIILPDKPSPSEKHAADELQLHLEKMTGQSIDIAASKDADKRKAIIVGRAELLKTRHKIQVEKYDRLGPDGIRIQEINGDLLLIGNKRGVLYAVYSMLEDFADIRWFTADCVRIPKKGTFEIPAKTIKTYIPKLRYRDTNAAHAREMKFAVRNKLNGMALLLKDPKWGGRIDYGTGHSPHTFWKLIPRNKYFKTHPEYFALVNGRRIQTQVCLTNPDVLKITIATVKRWIKERPNIKLFSVSQNDGHDYCECKKCAALAKKEGAQSGVLLHFVNAVADAVKKEYPDVTIVTLAYLYTQKIPKYVRPRDNIAIYMCTPSCCFAHPIATSKCNQKYRKEVEAWSKLTKRLRIYDYVVNFAHTVQPWPNLRVLKPNIKFFVKNNAESLYELASYYTPSAEFAELRAYMLAKLMWNPNYNDKKLIDEFLETYYGPAAKYISKYINLLHNTIAGNKNIHIRMYNPPVRYLNNPELLARSAKIFDQAEQAVKNNPVLFQRVKIARLPIQYTMLMFSKSKYKLKDNIFTSQINFDMLDEFLAVAKAGKIKRLGETHDTTLINFNKDLRNTPKSLKLISISSKFFKLGIIPEIGGRVWSLKYLPRKKELIKQFGNKKNGWILNSGGIEEYSSGSYRTPGWKENYKILEKGKDFIVLEAKLSNAYTMRKRYELDQKKPRFIITTELTNNGNTRNSQVRIHPEFFVPNSWGIKILERKLSGGWGKILLSKIPANGIYFNNRPRKVPNGAWGILYSNNMALINTFDYKNVKLAFIHYSKNEKRINLELWSKAKTLASGKKMIFRNVYEVKTNWK